MSRTYMCPDCYNHTLEEVVGTEHEDLYICNECGAELKGIMQPDGSMKFKEYIVDESYDCLDDCDSIDCNEGTEAAVTKNYNPKKQTDWALFVYNDSDNVVNMSGFPDVYTALEFAEDHNYPVIKLHRYYIENGKHYPDGNPLVIWKEGKAYNSFIEDDNGPIPDGEKVTLKESLEYPTYGKYHIELNARCEEAKELEKLVYDAFDTTTVIARITQDVVVTSHEDEYNVVFGIEVLDKYATLDEIRQAVIDHLEDNNVSVTNWNIKEC